MSTDDDSRRWLKKAIALQLAWLVVFAAAFAAGGYTLGLLVDFESLGSADSPNTIGAGGDFDLAWVGNAGNNGNNGPIKVQGEENTERERGPPENDTWREGGPPSVGTGGFSNNGGSFSNNGGGFGNG